MAVVGVFLFLEPAAGTLNSGRVFQVDGAKAAVTLDSRLREWLPPPDKEPSTRLVYCTINNNLLPAFHPP